MLYTEKETIGSWAADEHAVYTDKDQDGGDIVCLRPDHKNSSNNWDENAKLIAAAPKLFKVLENIARGQTGELQRDFIARTVKLAQETLLQTGLQK